MSEWYVVQATVNGRQLPTFLLDPNVQGIRNDSDAMAIAHEIIGYRDQDVSIAVCKMP